MSAPGRNAYPSDGFAGFTQGWDSIPSDPSWRRSDARVRGNWWYAGPQYADATTGCLGLAGRYLGVGGVSQGLPHGARASVG